MIEQDKQLLLKDLCARLPYKVKISIKSKRYGDLIGVLDAVYPSENRIIVDELNKAIATQNVRCGGFLLDECEVKPYLRPMSSMTEEEKAEIDDYLNKSIEGKLIGFSGRVVWLTDYYLSHHFDYRGLIKKGLALEAPEGMYNTKA